MLGRPKKVIAISGYDEHSASKVKKQNKTTPPGPDPRSFLEGLLALEEKIDSDQVL